MRVFIALLASLLSADGFKFLVYNPLRGRSHVNFMGRISEILIEEGHEVVMLAPVIDSSLPNAGTDKINNVIKVPPCGASKILAKHNDPWASKPFMETVQKENEMFTSWGDQCNATINHPGLLEFLRNEKFDAAITEPRDLCGYGIFHHVGIENIATIMSISINEGTSYFTGLPSFPSYVPGAFMNFAERMTFSQRVGNTLMLALGKFAYPYTLKPTEVVLQAKFGADFPDLYELVRYTSLWFLNAEPLIEFPRPIIHKVIDIGGIAVPTEHNTLKQSWSNIMDLRSKTVLISFGSVSKSSEMPEIYKQAITEVFRRFPNVTFIWKYEMPEHKISEGIPNLIEAAWLPQNDLLFDPRLSLFITHCGTNSLSEATTAGVPMIGIPIRADQIRNAAVVTRIGTGFIVKKSALETPEALATALEEMLEDKRYREKAQLLGEMIRNRPFSPRETFVRNMEFLARFGPLRMLDHYGRELNFVQYYLIDVLLFLASVIIVALYVLYRLSKFAFSLYCSALKAKTD